MRRILSLFSLLLFVIVLTAVAGFFLLPESFDAIWQQSGLPAAPLTSARALVNPQDSPADGATRLYGVLEAGQTYAMSELAGRAKVVLVTEGQQIAAGQPLLELDPSAVEAEVAAAEQGLRTAQATRAAAAAPPAQALVALAASAVAAAQTQLASARRSLAQAEGNLQQPLELQAEINRARSQMPVAEAAVKQAEAGVARVNVLLENAGGDGSREGQFTRQMLERQAAAARANVEAAQAQLDGLRRAVALLQQLRANPLALQAQVHAAEHQVRLAEAALALAEAEAKAAAEPPSPEAVAVAEAQVEAAAAALALARWQADRLTVVAPTAGRVEQRLVEPGETVEAGRPLISIADTAALKARVYVALADLGRVQVGQSLAVEVILAAEERRRADATVTYIAPEAQFRPANILNPDDRGDMVFLVELSIPNPDGALKAGMPVDVILP
jgi:HlyD family secretion protein